MKALVVYYSKNGTTKKMAQEIANCLEENNTNVKLGSIHEVTARDIEEADRLYIGCWTSGFLFFGQKPSHEWKAFARRIPITNKKKAMLFATYKVATGSMFKKMREELSFRGLQVSNKALKSKDGELKDIHLEILSQSLN